MASVTLFLWPNCSRGFVARLRLAMMMGVWGPGWMRAARTSSGLIQLAGPRTTGVGMSCRSLMLASSRSASRLSPTWKMSVGREMEHLRMDWGWVTAWRSLLVNRASRVGRTGSWGCWGWAGCWSGWAGSGCSGIASVGVGWVFGSGGVLGGAGSFWWSWRRCWARMPVGGMRRLSRAIWAWSGWLRSRWLWASVRATRGRLGSAFCRRVWACWCCLLRRWA